MKRLALIGDYSDRVPAHRAIPLALAAARDELGAAVEWTWVETRDLPLPTGRLEQFAGAWIAPASPYRNAAGVLEALRRMREAGRPLLGTCGGFQHMLIELARNLLQLPLADHAETNAGGDTLVVTALACSLVEQRQAIRFVPGSRLRAIYGTEAAIEGYRCRYGPNEHFRAAFEQAGLRFTAFDEDGQIRGAELPEATHPFFVGTLFQPERAIFDGRTPPLARALMAAVSAV